MPLFDEGVLFDGSEIFLPPPAPVGPPGYLGRFQLGQDIPLLVHPVDSAGFPTPPDSTPTATVTDPNGGTATFPLAMIKGPLAFGIGYRIPQSAPLGTFSIDYSYSVAGVPSTSSGSFDLVPGGDPGGYVMAMYSYSRPEAQYIVTQVSGGAIVMGRNPSI